MDGGDIRAMLKERRIFQWELARALGISEFTLVRWLRNGPLSEERAKAVQNAIEQLERPGGRSEGQG